MDKIRIDCKGCDCHIEFEDGEPIPSSAKCGKCGTEYDLSEIHQYKYKVGDLRHTEVCKNCGHENILDILNELETKCPYCEKTARIEKITLACKECGCPVDFMS